MTGYAFPRETQAFLADLGRHNDRAWFEVHRDGYRSAYVAAAVGFVRAAAPVLTEIVPGIHAEPKVLGSIFRINRDTRFSADKRPYKDHLDFWFWEGERRGAVSGLFLRVSPELVGVGVGAHGFERAALDRYRRAVADGDAGAELRGIVAGIERAGYELGGEAYTRTPAPYRDAPDQGQRLLRRRALFVHHDEPAGLAVDSELLLPTVSAHWRALAPLHRWLVAHVQRGANERQ